MTGQWIVPNVAHGVARHVWADPRAMVSVASAWHHTSHGCAEPGRSRPAPTDRLKDLPGCAVTRGSGECRLCRTRAGRGGSGVAGDDNSRVGMASITFEAAVELAKRTHASQVDQAGRPYLGHVLRVADAVRRDTERFAALIGDVGWGRRSGEDVARIAAVLHDILEDTDVTDEDLREAGCDDALMESLVALTRPEGEAYSDFLERLSADPVAVMVKRADIADNADEARLRLLPPEKAAALREKYRRAERELGFWALYRKVASLENDHPDGHHVYFRKT